MIVAPLKKALQLKRSGRLRLAVEGVCGNWIAAVGSKLGSETLIFNRYMFSGFHRGALETAPVATELLLHLYPSIRNAVDLGCGTGVYTSELTARGVQAIGFEYSACARRLAKELCNVDALPFDLRNFSGVQTLSDVCVCIEIAHYLPQPLGDALVRHCANAAPLVMFSSAHPGQHGYGHINAQSRQYWIDKFEKQGLQFNEAATARMESELRKRLDRGIWLAENICLFERLNRRASAILPLPN